MAASPALAARVDVVQVPPDPGTAYSVAWTANYSNTGSAESNSIVVDAVGSITGLDPDGIRFTDLRGHTITAGNNCKSLAPNSAVCRYPCTPSLDYECWWVEFVAAVVNLGPGTDTLTPSPHWAPVVWVNGGAGADVIQGVSGASDWHPDRLAGGDGNDTIVVGGPFTKISCGAGTDTVVWQSIDNPLKRPAIPADCENALPAR
jgi:Ca2+-binding RTX toxin-like protein